MRQTRQQVSWKIDRLAELKKRIARELDKANMLVLSIKQAGGGESKKFRATLHHIRAHDVHIRAHKQLRIAPK
jgi:hypothetical protein